MKRDAINSTKMKKLSRLLNIPHYAAVGIMETLWHLTGRETPQGDIGKLSNDDIALALGYMEDADRLIAALVECRWIDASEKFRLIIHDWHEHCEDAIDVKLARSLTLYANGSQPRMKRLSTEERAILSSGYLELTRNADKIATAKGIVCVARGLRPASVRTESHNITQIATEDHKKPLPMPLPLPVTDTTYPLPKEPESLPAAASGSPPDHGKELWAEAHMVAKEVAAAIGVTSHWAIDEIVKQAKLELQNKIGMDEVRDGMITQYRRYDKCVTDGKTKSSSPMNAQRFFGEGIWKDSRKWALKKGMTAD